MAEPILFKTLLGNEMSAQMTEIGRLRIAVFRAFPYLYDGTLEYEQEYLSTLATAKDAITIAAYHRGQMIGCATGSAIEDHHAAFAKPLAAAEVPLERVFYFAESVLLAPYRGNGIGHVFFDLRESWAKIRGYQGVAFCAVIRSENHPKRPENYRDLSKFWEGRGYHRIPEAIAMFDWKDVDDAEESTKPLQVWFRLFD